MIPFDEHIFEMGWNHQLEMLGGKMIPTLTNAHIFFKACQLQHSFSTSFNRVLLHLEDHPRTCKWLVTMVIVSPLSRVIPLINGLSMAYKWELLTTYELGWSSKHTFSQPQPPRFAVHSRALAQAHPTWGTLFGVCLQEFVWGGTPKKLPSM